MTIEISLLVFGLLLLAMFLCGMSCGISCANGCDESRIKEDKRILLIMNLFIALFLFTRWAYMG
jgi:hypothetical protein